ncbi:putative membrane dipeptidase [Rosellinia necatrix]|uniref:Dipeptidase n=1 Tax=Rosellinia necatrix TaxID=77044 RepID=A0A1W2TEM6_ROSNE|nr:putative membrane dipeptidase [Rosellinia necatrix]
MGIGIALFVLFEFQRFSVRASTWMSHYWSRAEDTVGAEFPLIDGHNDFLIWIRAFYQNHIYQENFTQDTELFGQVDFPRLRRGRSRGQFWSVYVECPKVADNYSDETYYEIVHDTLQQIDLVKRLIKHNSYHLTHAYTASDVREILQSGSHVASLMGIEGLHQIGNSASILRMYYSLGVRYATLTHTCHNMYAHSEEPPESQIQGLSEAGRAIVREMNRIGMIVDISHTSSATQRDVLQASTAPVIFSHSNAYTLCPHTRNVQDDVLHELKQNDGVIMITFYPSFLEPNSTAASIKSVVNHIMYVGEMIGYRHVGVGSDFDGMQAGPLGLEDVSKYPNLFRELLDRGVSSNDILGIAGMNVLRALESAERVALSLSDVLPLEDDVKPFF